MDKNRIKDFIVKDNCILYDAMKVINRNSCSIVFVVDENDKLIGSLSDGDIRRWFINKGDMDSKVINVMNKSPKYITKEEEMDPYSYMNKLSIRVLPLLDDHKIIDIYSLKDHEYHYINNESLKDYPVVIMAGGKGTRLYPYTKILPKPLIPIGEVPVIEHIINSFKRFGCKDFYLVVNYKKNMIKAYFNEEAKDHNIYFIDEEEPLGTGGGLSLLKGIINKTFVLTNCDTLIDDDYSNIVKEHKEKNNIVTMITSLKNFEIPYGVVETDDNNSIVELKEKPKFSFYTNTGTYIVEKEVIDTLKENERIDFPDIIKNLKDDNKKVGVYKVDEDAWMDMGQFDSLEKMNKRMSVSK